MQSDSFLRIDDSASRGKLDCQSDNGHRQGCNHKTDETENNIEQPQIRFESLITEELVLISNKEQAPIHHLNDIAKGTILVFKQGCTYRRKIEEWV